MKRTAKILCFSVALFALAGCVGKTTPESATDSSKNSPATESKKKETAENTSIKDIAESDTAEANDVSSEESIAASEKTVSVADEQKDEEPLSQYSNEQIEYARIWLQLGANQEIDRLFVRHIPVGTPLNPDDETSGTYPEDVIQLAGSRLVDGSVTYSGNGDGTINVYKVPLRWDGQYPAGEDFYRELIENTKLVAVDTGDDKEIIRLIELLNIQP